MQGPHNKIVSFFVKKKIVIALSLKHFARRILKISCKYRVGLR